MLVYEGIKTSFIEDVDLGIIADKIRTKYIEIIKRRPSPPEFNSWKNSMQYMRGVLNDTEIPNSTGIAIEYNISSIPCLILFENGKEVKRSVGLVPVNEIESLFED